MDARMDTQKNNVSVQPNQVGKSCSKFGRILPVVKEEIA